MTKSAHRYEMALEIGEEAVRQSRWQQALTCFQTAQLGLPAEPRVYNGLGDTYLALADPNRALSYYKEAARLAGGDPSYTVKVAALLATMGQTAEAVAAYLHAGDHFWTAGDPDRARAGWGHAAQLDPDRAAVHERLAMSDRLRGDTRGAVRHYIAQAGALRREGRCLPALHVAYTALGLLPADAAVWRATEETWRCVATRGQDWSRAAARVEPGDLVSAATEFAQWQLTTRLQDSPLSGAAAATRDLYLRQALFHEGHGRAGQAILAYEHAIVAGAQPPAIFFALGLLYRLVNRRDDARAALTLAARHPFYRRAVALLE